LIRLQVGLLLVSGHRISPALLLWKRISKGTDPCYEARLSLIMAHPVAKLLIGFFIVAALLVAAAVVFTLSQPAPVSSPLPQPNGYDDFLKAGNMVADEPSGYGTMSEEELRAFVKMNAEALKLGRIGLGRECRVPLDYSVANATHSQDLARIKWLACTLTAEGRLAEMENHLRDAAESYLDTVPLGHAITQGGLIIESLAGSAIESIGMARLENLVRNLDSKQCREVASALEAIESGRESAETVLEREHVWDRRIRGFMGQIDRLVRFKSVQQFEQKWAGRVRGQQTRTRLLLLQLATHAYELEQGKRPKSLADLVPAYLKAIPRTH
jgi:hypothetical protein